ncbi:ATP-binding cassette domain-containing protein [Nonomuraea phyllanthi]|uniref:ATP-binding cassette domain-containing protein n=1 Tax=Nonomuraea phyllanthi TaxID=2219224 RepID=A0A5C4WMU9_9ACTN|nr:ABC transporter ATP-binding protein [Nonomuraea phyllanthi]KAB8194652.1 ATP-binding cassette domain-containing protein [Nonomuraea phyllanthi]
MVILSPRRRLLAFLLLAGRPWLAAVALLELFLLVEPTAVALAIGELVGRLTQGAVRRDAAWSDIGTLLALLGALLVTGNVLRSMSQPLAERVGWRIDAAVREELTSRVLALPSLDRVEAAAVQDELAVMRSPLLTWTDEGIGAAAVGRFRAGLTMAGLVTAMLVLSSVVWWWGPATVAAALLLGRYRSGMWREFFKVVSGTMPAAMRGRAWAAMLSDNRDAKEVRVFGLTGWLEEHAEENIADAARRVVDARTALLRREMSVFLGWAATASVVYVAVATSGEASVGRIAAAVGAVSAMFVISMSSQGEDMDEVAMPAVDAVTRIRALAPEVTPPPAPDGAREIVLRDVVFEYGQVRVLNGVTLTLRPGEVIAVVGVNGAGKTTLAKLLTGQYRPKSGTLVIEPAAYAVYQDFNRYELSAYENIRIAAPEATREQVEAAAVAVGAAALIERLPRGWATVLSPKYAGGADLSGGQWQKIALARAALAAARGARLLVLDEPTANLDIEAELETFDRIRQVRGRAAVVLISHRFSTVRKADRIVVLSGGRITEDGTHDDLLAADGEYARMFRLQARQFKESA